MKRSIFALVAMDQGRVIGNAGKIPWHIPEDMQRFKELTTGHAVLMGRKTYQSLPERFRPLPGRKNLVVTRRPESLATERGIEVWNSTKDCVRKFLSGELETPSNQLWVIGGAEIYKETLPFCDEIYLTLVHARHTGDTFFPAFEEHFQLLEEHKKPGHTFLHYKRHD